MPNLSLQTCRREDIARLVDFFKGYLNKYPDARLNRPEFYTNHPALEEGENVLCVLHAGQQMVGFAPLFPILLTPVNAATGPYDIWTIILASPDLENAEAVRNLLFSGVLERAGQLKARYGLSQVRLAADMMVSQKDDMEYLRQKGFEPFEQVYVMNRDPSQTIPTVSAPPEITFRPSKLTSEAEQATYLAIFNSCFPESPKTAEALQFLLQSPLWERGQVIAACSASNELIGSILVYWDEPKDYGLVDEVMVLPSWRGRNIAKRLIGEALSYLKALGISDARLEVKASNAPAVCVYTAMGYRIIGEECLLAKFI